MFPLSVSTMLSLALAALIGGVAVSFTKSLIYASLDLDRLDWAQRRLPLYSEQGLYFSYYEVCVCIAVMPFREKPQSK